MTDATPAPTGADALREALIKSSEAILSMKVEAETAAQGDEQMMLEACEQISNEGLEAYMAIRAALASAAAPKAESVPAGVREELREGASYESMNLAAMVLSDCGHSSNYEPLLERVAGRIDRHVERLLTAQRAALASTAQPPAPAAQGDAQQRAMHARNSDNALAEGWKEAAIAWEVCASVHRAWGKGRDALFTTRQADYLRHAQMAQERHVDLTRPTGEAPGGPSESSHDLQFHLFDQRDPARAAAKEGDRDE